MRTATNRQVAADAPLLYIALELTNPNQVHATGVLRVEGYDDSAKREDRKLWPDVTPSITFVCLRVENIQNEPFSAARDIVITVELRSRDTPPAASTPEANSILRDLTTGRIRTVRIPVLGAGHAQFQPVFDTGVLMQFDANIASLEYYDLRGRKARSAAYGELKLQRTAMGAVSATSGYFEPKRWEMP